MKLFIRNSDDIHFKELNIEVVVNFLIPNSSPIYQLILK